MKTKGNGVVPGGCLSSLWWVCLSLVLVFIAMETSGTGPAVGRPARGWIVDVQGEGDFDFRLIMEAIMDSRVLSGDALLIRGGNNRVYREFITTATNSGKIKELDFIGTNGVPIITWPTNLTGQVNFHLEGGRLVERLSFQGYVNGQRFGAGLRITAPSVIRYCEFAGYSNAFVGFCAANPTDNPSLFTQNMVVDNEVGIVTGDREHVYEYNIVQANRLGFECATGSQARILNNVICSNTSHGVFLSGYMTNWAGMTDIGNNTIANNQGHGIYLEWMPAGEGDRFGMPICPYIHNNIIVSNIGCAIDANTIYGPMICTPKPIGVQADWQLSATVGGCYPQIRHNVIYANQNGLAPKDSITNQFWWAEVTNGEGEGTRRIWHVPDPWAFGGLQPQNRYEDPGLTNRWYLLPGSPCLDNGDIHLRPGYTQQGVSTSSVDAAPMLDTGQVDVGYHHPLGIITEVKPALSISKTLSPTGKTRLELAVVGGLEGDVYTLMTTSNLGTGPGPIYPVANLFAWPIEDVYILGEVPEGDEGSRRRFFWLK